MNILSRDEIRQVSGGDEGAGTAVALGQIPVQTPGIWIRKMGQSLTRDDYVFLDASLLPEAARAAAGEDLWGIFTWAGYTNGYVPWSAR
ncbi:hypothetical protein [Burkholderia ubonensis]|uniref:hypothetical protein n=1 Tax=Burkholderia ubonensis TaxID=101571 RepID=UPI0012F8D47E|nr:hypothetical protein [Burkholderia ubonensis]